MSSLRTTLGSFQEHEFGFICAARLLFTSAMTREGSRFSRTSSYCLKLDPKLSSNEHRPLHDAEKFEKLLVEQVRLRIKSPWYPDCS